MDSLFLTLDEVLAIHADQIERFGIAEGRYSKSDAAVFLAAHVASPSR